MIGSIFDALFQSFCNHKTVYKLNLPTSDLLAYNSKADKSFLLSKTLVRLFATL